MSQLRSVEHWTHQAGHVDCHSNLSQLVTVAAGNIAVAFKHESALLHFANPVFHQFGRIQKSTGALNPCQRRCDSMCNRESWCEAHGSSFTPRLLCQMFPRKTLKSGVTPIVLALEPCSSFRASVGAQACLAEALFPSCSSKVTKTTRNNRSQVGDHEFGNNLGTSSAKYRQKPSITT
jgi:hypothetical protein